LTQRNALRQSASTAEALWADGLALATPVTVLLGTGRTVKGCVGRPRAQIGRDGEGGDKGRPGGLGRRSGTGRWRGASGDPERRLARTVKGWQGWAWRPGATPMWI